MHKLEVTLKQHTPLIHFQHDQEGATLRASEVKPKLDRFILTRLGGGDYDAGVEEARKNGWLVGKGDKPALNYKMRIKSVNLFDDKMEVKCKKDKDTRELKYNTPYPLVVCNLNKSSIDEILNFSISQNVIITILTSIEEIESIINQSDTLNDFFGLNNFGNRQNKGFGSFSVVRINGEYIGFSDFCYYKDTQYIYVNEKLAYNEVFVVIESFWKKIKKKSMQNFNKKAKLENAERIPSTVYFKPLFFNNYTKVFMIYEEDLDETEMMDYLRTVYPTLTFSVKKEDKIIECKIEQLL